MSQGHATDNPVPTRVLVTGAGGYIGRHVVAALLEQRASVIAVGRSLSVHDFDSAVNVITADIFEDCEDPFERFHSPDVCIHLAWEPCSAHDAPGHLLDLSKHYEFLTRMMQGGLPQLVVAGTMHEVGYHEGEVDEWTPTSPQTLYGISKDALRRSLFRFIETESPNQRPVLQWIRCFYVFGDDDRGQSLFTKIRRAWNRGDTHFPLTHATRRLDFVDIHTVARQIAVTSLQQAVEGVLNAGSGRPVEMKTMIESYLANNGIEIALDFGAYPERSYDSPALWGNPDKMNRILAAAPRDS